VEALPSCKHMTPTPGAVLDCPSSPDHFTGILDHIEQNGGPLPTESWTTCHGTELRSPTSRPSHGPQDTLPLILKLACLATSTVGLPLLALLKVRDRRKPMPVSDCWTSRTKVDPGKSGREDVSYRFSYPAGMACSSAAAATPVSSPWVGHAGEGLNKNIVVIILLFLPYGRENWIHIGSQQPGPRVAAILSVVESCRRLKIPVRACLGDILPGLANTKMQRVADLTPDAWAARHTPHNH
jgi:hypothetical protein